MLVGNISQLTSGGERVVVLRLDAIKALIVIVAVAFLAYMLERVKQDLVAPELGRQLGRAFPLGPREQLVAPAKPRTRKKAGS